MVNFRVSATVSPSCVDFSWQAHMTWGHHVVISCGLPRHGPRIEADVFHHLLLVFHPGTVDLNGSEMGPLGGLQSEVDIPKGQTYKKRWKFTMLLISRSTMSMAIFNSFLYVCQRVCVYIYYVIIYIYYNYIFHHHSHSHAVAYRSILPAPVVASQGKFQPRLRSSPRWRLVPSSKLHQQGLA